MNEVTVNETATAAPAAEGMAPQPDQSVAKTLFAGKILHANVFPYPRMAEAERETLEPMLDAIDAQASLVDGSRLAHLAVVQADEVGALAGEVGEHDLTSDQRAARRRDELVEVGLLVAHRSRRYPGADPRSVR